MRFIHQIRVFLFFIWEASLTHWVLIFISWIRINMRISSSFRFSLLIFFVIWIELTLVPLPPFRRLADRSLLYLWINQLSICFLNFIPSFCVDNFLLLLFPFIVSEGLLNNCPSCAFWDTESLLIMTWLTGNRNIEIKIWK